jgi:hypothetical protein
MIIIKAKLVDYLDQLIEEFQEQEYGFLCNEIDRFEDCRVSARKLSTLLARLLLEWQPLYVPRMLDKGDSPETGLGGIGCITGYMYNGESPGQIFQMDQRKRREFVQWLSLVNQEEEFLIPTMKELKLSHPQYFHDAELRFLDLMA